VGVKAAGGWMAPLAKGLAAVDPGRGTAEPERIPAVEAAVLRRTGGAAAAALGPTRVGRCGMRG
jgi:hypothetical protein